jgi:pyruvate dehydrogenase E1 component alpha subunit
MITKEMLIEFEKEMHDKYANAEIKGPVHLSCGNEEQLIEIFKDIKDDDWVFSTWRSHYHALLKSKDFDWVRKEIVEGRSIHLNSAKYKIFTSAIVGGIIPIALGVAMANKRLGNNEMVYVFIGDMTSMTGIYNECLRYAIGFDLPIKFIVENNNISVYTPTQEVWGNEIFYDGEVWALKPLYEERYNYKREPYPHHGIGQWIDFEKNKHWGPAF